MRLLALVELQRGDVAVVAEFLVAHLGGLRAVGDGDAVDHHVRPLLRVGEVEVLDLEPARKQVGQERIGHGGARLQRQPDDQAVALAQRRRFPRLSLQRIERAPDGDVVVVRRRRRARDAGDVGHHVQRQVAFGQEAHARADVGGIEYAAPQPVGFDRGARVAHHQRAGDHGIAVTDQGAAEAGDGDLFLRAEVAPAGAPAALAGVGRVVGARHGTGELEHTRVVARARQAVAVRERDHEGGVAQVRAVVAEVPRPLHVLVERFRDGLLRARRIAHQLERDAEVHQRQGGDRLAALVVEQRAQRAERGAVDPRQHVAGVGLVGEPQVVGMLVAVEGMAAGEEVVVEPLQRLLQHAVGHQETFLACIEQELDDVRGQHFVDAAVAAPHREVARGDLHRCDAADRAIHALLARGGIEALDVQVGRGPLVQQQRAEALAGGLFGAAVGVLQEILERTGEWQRRQARHRQPRGDRRRQQPLDRRTPEHHRLDLLQRGRDRAAHLRPGWAHGQLERAVHPDVAAAGFDANAADALSLQRRQWEGERRLGLVGEGDAALSLADRERRLGRYGDVECALAPGEVLQVERQARRVARREHARRGYFGHQRRAHHGFGIRATEAVGGVDNGRHAHGAVEVRHGECHRGVALCVQLHRPGKEVHRLHARSGAARLRQRFQRHVAAPAQACRIAVETLDHAAVEVVGVHPERTLGEEPGQRVGAREARDVEDADIDRRHCHPRVLASQRRRVHAHREVLLRLHLRRHLQRDLDLARAAVDRHVRLADGARRRGARDGRAAAEHQRGDVHVVALPVFRHRDRVRRPGRGVDGARVEQVVGFDQQQAGSGLRRRDGHLQRVAGAIGRLVERQLHLVRARFLAAVVVIPAPAGVEGQARHQSRGGVGHLEPVVAPFHRDVDAGGRARADVHLALLGFLEARVVVEMPAALLVERPVVVAPLAYQRDAQSLRGQQLAGGIAADQLEAGAAIGAGALGELEQRPHPHQLGRRPDGALERARDGAPAGFVHAAGNDRGHRRLRLRRVAEVDVLRQLALRIERGVDHVARFLRQLDGRVAEPVILARGDRMRVGGDRQARGEAVAGGRRAVQVGTGHPQRQRLSGLQHGGGRIEIELQPLGQELLDAEGGALRDDIGLRVGAELHLPAARRGVGGDLARPFDVAERARIEPALGVDAPVRLLEGQEQRLRRQRLAVMVA